jgi:hypothetical protein
LQRFEDAEKVRETCADIRRTNQDAHLLFSQVGERLGLVPEQTVAAAFTTLWAQANGADVVKLVAQITTGSALEATGAA